MFNLLIILKIIFSLFSINDNFKINNFSFLDNPTNNGYSKEDLEYIKELIKSKQESDNYIKNHLVDEEENTEIIWTEKDSVELRRKTEELRKKFNTLKINAVINKNGMFIEIEEENSYHVYKKQTSEKEWRLIATYSKINQKIEQIMKKEKVPEYFYKSSD